MNWKRSWIAGAVAIPFVSLLAVGMTLDPRALPSTMPGKPAPEFELEVMEARNAPEGPPLARLAEHRGEVVVLNFWASWCMACRSEHASLSRIAQMYEGRGVQFYGVLYNDSPANAERYILQQGGQSYPTLLDPGTRTAIDYGLYGVPETFFIGPDGQIAYKHVGPVNDALLIEWIEKIRNAAMEEPS
jgi:cytochrome c biogenesis protein CcmG, thiol:disulfide interchange protein DsbE